jgi:hypothetical protein
MVKAQWLGFAHLFRPTYACANMGHPYRVGVSERVDYQDASQALFRRINQ